MPQPRTFAGPDAFRAWLEANHTRAEELLVRCYKSHARHKGMTHSQALDEALCFGWIDGVRRSLDDDTFSVRFSPRRPKSGWSAINAKRAAELEAAGRMRPAGLAALRARKTTPYSYEARAIPLDPAYVRRFRRDQEAWAFFRGRPPWYQRTSAFWVMSAKRPETRERRLEVLISCSRRRTTIPPLTRPAARGPCTQR